MSSFSNPVASEVAGLPSFQFTVNDPDTVWIHCEQTGHCGKGTAIRDVQMVPFLLTVLNRNGFRN